MDIDLDKFYFRNNSPMYNAYQGKNDLNCASLILASDNRDFGIRSDRIERIPTTEMTNQKK